MLQFEKIFQILNYEQGTYLNNSVEIENRLQIKYSDYSDYFSKHVL